jgi:hypothetical protein
MKTWDMVPLRTVVCDRQSAVPYVGQCPVVYGLRSQAHFSSKRRLQKIMNVKTSPTLEGNMWHNTDFPITIDCYSQDAQDLHTAGSAFPDVHLFLFNFRSCFHTTFDHVRHCVTHISFQRNRLMMYGFWSMPCYVHIVIISTYCSLVLLSPVTFCFSGIPLSHVRRRLRTCK